MNNDLISRSELKKVFDNLGCLTVNVESIIDIIPTINTEDCEGCPYCNADMREGGTE